MQAKGFSALVIDAKIIHLIYTSLHSSFQRKTEGKLAYLLGCVPCVKHVSFEILWIQNTSI